MGLFNVEQQLSFYGAYHANKWNILIHMTFVPLILWSSQVFLARLPTPSFLPHIVYPINQYLVAETNWPAVLSFFFWTYYLILEPLGAVLYLPQFTLSLLTATAFARNYPQKFSLVVLLHVSSWIAQFIGHGVAEKRSPALLDNLVGALVLAPFFVHLEELFFFGYKPELHKKIMNLVGKEITRIRTIEGKKRRAATGVDVQDGVELKTL